MVQGLSVAMAGLASTSAMRCSYVNARPPVDSWVMPGHTSRTASTVLFATSRSAVMLPWSSRRWMWMTAAPAS